MSIKFEKVEKEEFSANMATLYCDKTGLKMLDIIIKESTEKHIVSARWSDSKELTTGSHEIIGKIYCSPIETVTQKTSIIRDDAERKDGGIAHKFVVKKIK